MATMNIPSEYGYVVMSASFIGIVQYGLGGAVMSKRKAFKADYFLQKKEVKDLQDEHKKLVGGPIDSNGYPDMGSGMYSQHLSLQDWLELNKAQRAHYNTIETSAPALASILATGLYFPRTAAILGFTYGIGRILYAYGYMSSGPGGRLVGAVFGSVSLLGLWGMGFFIGARTAGLV